MKTPMFLIPAILLSMSSCFADGVAGAPTGVQLTIYNQDFALVKEDREMTLDNGINLISVPDVASTIEPDSVAFKSLTDPNSVVVREQSYLYDVIDPTTILNKSVGKKIKIRYLSNGSVQEIEGTLLNPATVTVPQTEGDVSPYQADLETRTNGLVIQTATGVVMFPNTNSIDSVEVESLPEGLTARPTLLWKLETDKPGTHQTEISYLANHITWKADYVAVIDPSDAYVDITGWVTLNNNTGTTYENATLNLMAGETHMVEQPRPMPQFGGGRFAAMAAVPAQPQFQEKSFFEYHIYTLKDKTTVRDKETKQLTLMTAAQVPAKKLYIYDGRKDWWAQWRYNDYRPGESYDVSANKKINVIMEIVNSKGNNLGIPLPKGTVRTYKEQADANRQFVGEDEIDHTPKDEKIRLYLGDAFDIVGEHTRTDFRRITDTEVEETFEISIRNHKDTPVSVTDVEHLTGDWEIMTCSQKYFKKDASTVEIPVDVPQNGETKIDYTVRTKW